MTHRALHGSPRSLALLLAALAALVALASSALGCSAIVASDPGDIACDLSEDGRDPCPEGLQCFDGWCTSCSPGVEICDGIDNDCDGEVDEGLAIDADGDGFLACNPGGLADCNDSNPDIHPHVPELDPRGDAPWNYEPCNGIDDDCDPSTLETAGCGPGFICFQSAEATTVSCARDDDCNVSQGRVCGASTYCDVGGQCLAIPVGVDCVPGTRDPHCSATEFCGVDGACTPLRAPGEGCDRSAECASGLCFKRTVLGERSEEGVCIQSCCTDADCPDEFDCFAPGNGTRTCMPRGTTSTPRLCSRPSECPAGTSCRALNVSGGAQRSQCEASGDRFPPGSICALDSMCDSGVCLDAFCAEPCGSTSDCSSGTCQYTPRSATVPFCVWSWAPETGRTGDRCSSGCRDGGCVNDLCADTCCSDKQCQAGTRCVPVTIDRIHEMRCVAVGSPPIVVAH